jgi:hypothetical protein
MQDNIICQQKKRIIGLKKMVEAENERTQIIERKAKVHDS